MTNEEINASIRSLKKENEELKSRINNDKVKVMRNEHTIRVLEKSLSLNVFAENLKNVLSQECPCPPKKITILVDCGDKTLTFHAIPKL